MPKSKEQKYPLDERIGDFVKWTWEGMTRDIKKAIGKGGKKLDIYRTPTPTPPEEPLTPGDQEALDSIFWGENLRPRKPKVKK